MAPLMPPTPSTAKRSYCCPVFLYMTPSDKPRRAELIEALRSISRMQVVGVLHLSVHLANLSSMRRLAEQDRCVDVRPRCAEIIFFSFCDWLWLFPPQSQLWLGRHNKPKLCIIVAAFLSFLRPPHQTLSLDPFSNEFISSSLLQKWDITICFSYEQP